MVGIGCAEQGIGWELIDWLAGLLLGELVGTNLACIREKVLGTIEIFGYKLLLVCEGLD